VHSSVPYIDPSRIRGEMYRPDCPDKWITQSGGINAYRKR
jgi:hypothetical protein